ncbi:MAG TPA: aminomethyl-transferring glycine dehydrogenase, partial [Ilumatobacteraceae bacterium]
MRASLDQLVDVAEFTRRHTSATPADREHMLAVIGEPTIESLLDHTVPKSIRMTGLLPLDGPRTAADVLGELQRMAARNAPRTSLIGMGYYGTITPPVVVRNVLENPAWYTAYTPYQPEISQGRLEALLNFQTMVCELTGFTLANASLLDEATAAAEAMTMARRLSSAASNRFVVHHDTHPQTIAVLHTRAEPIGVELVVGDVDEVAAGCFGAMFSLPTSSGAIPDWREAIASVHEQGALAIVATDLLACVLTVPPGQLGADIAVGSAQRFGVSMGYGGPHAAFIAANESAARALPGRLVGVSTDTAGRPALRLALQTREQHIRRERATSNICTAQVLLANIAGLYATWHGPDGLRTIAERTHRLTSIAVDHLRRAGLALVNETWFDTVQVRCDAPTVLARAAAAGLDLRLVDEGTIGFSFDETSSPATVVSLLAAFGIDTEVGDTHTDGLPARRTDEFLTQTVFARYHTEHEMLRYLRRLADKDLALDRTMIPLGSCTMKLNATLEMEPLTWPGLADMHPFSPDECTIGIREMISQLESMLLAITGYDAVSLQPNAGSQGEFSGLLAIRAYHRSRGEHGRNVCLIPSSAHGTNAASAVMAGLKVVVVACDQHGYIDLADLEARAAAAGDALAAAMITYPSTHGVFETDIGEICDIVHRHGGQVYVDGANLNAMVGLAQPGKFGADVSHLNLHKTFCIPHGGGGPGVGPVAVRAHLAPFLPAHPLASTDRPVGAVAAAPYGSAAILAISWVYIALMGGAGLTDASEMAVLNANYLAARLDPHFPVLYSGEHGHVGHECILDVRPLTKATGVTIDDVAKRLIDFGFHAPTVSFPVAGTLMVEPTESESLYELDRFCEAMIAIKGEIDAVAAGTWPIEESPLRHAPHTAEDVTGPWERPYDRQLGAYPVAALRAAKYFPPVSRIDAAYGDRHLMCTCEPLEVLAAASA